MSGVTLTLQKSQVGTINNQRVLVAVPLLYVFMTHYMFQILKSLKNAYQATERLNDLGKRVFLYGMVCLFSMNFVQGTVIGAVIAWANLILLIIAHCFVFLKQTGQKYHNINLLIYYTLLLIWFGVELFFYVYGFMNQ